MMNYLIKLCFLFHFSFLWSQSADDMKFSFFNASTRLFVIGEAHFEDDAHLQVNLIDYIQQNGQIDVLIVEFPAEPATIFNQYVMNGTRESDVESLLLLISNELAKKYWFILDYLRQHNLSNSNKIKVIGIDTFHFHDTERELKALSVIFPELRDKNMRLLDKFLFSSKKKKYKKSETVIFDSLIHDLSQNRSLYQKHLGNRFQIYEESIRQAQMNSAEHDWVKRIVKRESFLSKNLMNIIDSNERSVMICGAFHALYKENDKWAHGSPYTSMTAVAKKRYPDQVFSIVTQYYEKKLIRIFPDFDLLENTMKYYVEKHDVKYVVIEGKVFDENEFAKQRCNMIIIQDKKYKAN